MIKILRSGINGNGNSRFLFSVTVDMGEFKELQFKNPIWSRSISYLKKAEVEQLSPQIVVQKLKYMDSRNEFFQTLKHLQLQQINQTYYKKALYDSLNIEETFNLCIQGDAELNDLAVYRNLIQQKLRPERIVAIRFALQNGNNNQVNGFFEVVLNIVQGLRTKFQQTALQNIASNLNQLLFDFKRNQVTGLREIIVQIGQVLEQNGYLQQQHPQVISQILGNLSDIITNQNIVLQPQELVGYQQTAQTFIEKYPILQKTNNFYKLTQSNHKEMLFTLFFAQECPKSISDDIVNQFVDQQIEYGCYESIIDLLGLMLLHKIPCTEKMLSSIQQFKKYYKFKIIQIFIIIKSYEFAQIPLNEYSIVLFQQLLFMITSEKKSYDQKQLIMLTKIMRDLFQSPMSTSRLIAEKRTERLVVFVEKQVLSCPEQISMNNLLFISNTVNKYLMRPGFLFEQLSQRQNEMEIEDSSLFLYLEFLDIVLQKYAPQYSYFSKSDQQFSMNYQPTPSLSQCADRIIQLLFDSKRLGSQEILHKVLLIATIPGINLTKQTIDNLHLALNEQFIRNTEYTVDILQFIINHKINDQALIKAIMQVLETQFMTQSDLIHSVYLLTRNPTIATTHQLLLQKIFNQSIMKGAKNNQKLLIKSIQIEQALQLFSQCSTLDNFNSYQYLLPIIDSLQIALPEQSLKILQQQFNRCCKAWEGDILIDNLILYQKYQIHDYDMFTKVSENLLSCFEFNREYGHFQWRTIDPTRTLKLVQAYIYQLQQLDEKPIIREGVKLIGFLANQVFDKLTITEQISLFGLLGNSHKMYYDDLIIKLGNIAFYPNAEIIKYASQYTIIHNFSLKRALKQYLSKSKDWKVTSELFQAAKNTRTVIPGLNALWIDLDASQQLQLLPQVLEYLIHTHYPGQDIGSIMQFTQQNQSNLDIVNKCRYLFLSSLDNLYKSYPTRSDTHSNQCFRLNQIKQINNQLNTELRSLVDNMITDTSLGNTTLNLSSLDITYNPCMVLGEDENQKAQWKIYQVDRQFESDMPKLFQFLQQEPELSQVNPIREISQFINNLNLSDIMEFPILLEEYNSLISKSKLDQLTKSEDYVNFLIAFTLSIPVTDRHYNYSTNVESQKTQNIVNLRVVDKEESQGLSIFYASPHDIVYANDKIYPSPLLYMKALKQSQYDEVLIINFEEWIKINYARKKQEEFVEQLFIEVFKK